jgi:4-amino-4-deoxy-L-arabinose transferase-like glycosyltransferase
MKLSSALARLLRLRLEIALIVALGLAALGSGINEAPLVDWDEATYAEVTHEALAAHDYLRFTWNNEPYVKKPPLLFWTLAASFGALGESEFAARLPSVVFGAGTLVLIYLSATLAAGRLAGTLAALIPLQFYFFVARGGRECATDAPLLFFMTLAIYATLRARGSRRWAAVAGVASGLAILSKGLAGTLALIVAPLAVVLVPGFETVGTAGLTTIFVCAGAVATPWYVYAAFHNPLFWSSFVGHETLARIVRHLEDETRPGSYTLRVFAEEARFLWPLLLPLGALTLTAERRVAAGEILGRLHPAVGLWLVWLAIALGAACTVQTKLPWYVLPALMPVALLGGTLAARTLTYRGPMRTAVISMDALALMLIALHAPARWNLIADAHHVQRLRSAPSYAMGLKARRAAALAGGGELYFAGVELPTLVYYARMRCKFVKSSNDLTRITDPGAAAPPPVERNELMLVDSQGRALPITTLDAEWQLAPAR